MKELYFLDNVCEQNAGWESLNGAEFLHTELRFTFIGQGKASDPSNKMS